MNSPYVIRIYTYIEVGKFVMQTEEEAFPKTTNSVYLLMEIDCNKIKDISTTSYAMSRNIINHSRLKCYLEIDAFIGYSK